MAGWDAAPSRTRNWPSHGQSADRAGRRSGPTERHSWPGSTFRPGLKSGRRPIVLVWGSNSGAGSGGWAGKEPAPRQGFVGVSIGKGARVIETGQVGEVQQASRG